MYKKTRPGTRRVKTETAAAPEMILYLCIREMKKKKRKPRSSV